MLGLKLIRFSKSEVPIIVVAFLPFGQSIVTLLYVHIKQAKNRSGFGKNH